jgi:hypothetical protein
MTENEVNKEMLGQSKTPYLKVTGEKFWVKYDPTKDLITIYGDEEPWIVEIGVDEFLELAGVMQSFMMELSIYMLEIKAALMRKKEEMKGDSVSDMMNKAVEILK